jgi:hypothetical protein
MGHWMQLISSKQIKIYSHLNVRQSHKHSGSAVVEALGLECEVWGSSSLGSRFSFFYKELMPWVRWRLRGSEVGPRCLRGSEVASG